VLCLARQHYHILSKRAANAKSVIRWKLSVFLTILVLSL